MELKFLGTAAYEGIPALFCSCSTCMKSKELGGRNIRKRSSVLIDNKIMIDFTPDILWYVHNYNLDSFNLEHLFITHSHSDHFNFYDLEAKLKGYANEGNPKLNVYANDASVDVVEDMIKMYDLTLDSVKNELAFHRMKPYSKVKADEYEITALPATHHTCYKGENTFIFVISKGGLNVLYGNDSAVFKDEVFESLKGIYLNCIILDCTHGVSPKGSVSHMNFKENLEIIKKLETLNIIDEKTVKISTHYSHNGGAIYDVHAPKFLEEGVIMAYDGMEIKL